MQLSLVGRDVRIAPFHWLPPFLVGRAVPARRPFFQDRGYVADHPQQPLPSTDKHNFPWWGVMSLSRRSQFFAMPRRTGTARPAFPVYRFQLPPFIQ